jgi:hypothetical protein
MTNDDPRYADLFTLLAARPTMPTGLVIHRNRPRLRRKISSLADGIRSRYVNGKSQTEPH